MIPLPNKLISWYFKQRIAKVRDWIEHPVEKQEKTLQYLLQTAQQTAWGKHHQYANIKTTAAFKDAVALQNYDSLKPYIQRSLEGEQNVLWHSPIQWFAKSSGTTSDRSKFLPVSKEAMWQCHFEGGKDVLTLYTHHNKDTEIFKGKCLVIGGSHQLNNIHANARYGDLSAVLLQNMPWLGRRLRTPDLSLAIMDNWEEKIEQIAQQIIQENITYFAGVPTWNLVLFKRILEISKRKNIGEVWKNLRLYLHGGVSFTPYVEQFQQLIPNANMQYWQTYNASEGYFGMQESPDREDMLLMVNHGIFYEFIPMEYFYDDPPKTIGLEEVEVDKNYALVISTNAGLWRYIIGDTIQFTSINPFRIRVSGRTKHYINAFGEEVIIDNADKAIATACQRTGAKVCEYSVAPIYFNNGTNGTHEWLIEFTTEPNNLVQFTHYLDDALKQLNTDYEAKRYKDMAMRLPIVHALPKGTFYKWLKNKNKLGGQHKIPRLANHRKYVEEMKELLVH